MAGRGAGGRPPAGRRGRDRILRPGAGGGHAPRGVERLRAWAGRLPPARLAHWASRLDRRFAGGGRQRAARAVEVALLTGRPLGWWQGHARETGAMRAWYIHLTLPRDVLQRRIAERVDRMLAAGLVGEVQDLLARGVAPAAPGLDGVGYREVVAVLAGRLSQRELRDAIVTDPTVCEAAGDVVSQSTASSVVRYPSSG